MLDFRNLEAYTAEDVKKFLKIVESKRKLNLGCGGIDIRPDFVNVDIQMFKGMDAAINAFDLRVMNDDSVNFIVAQHLLEYIPRQHMVTAILEWKRILEPEGMLEIRVTDLSQLTKALYLNSVSSEMGFSDEMVISLLYGQQLDAFDIRCNGFTPHFLQGVLVGLGFRVVSLVAEDLDFILTACKK
jgi:ubiquinone/menaquinone biosynthesis C-methylase UbiE